MVTASGRESGRYYLMYYGGVLQVDEEEQRSSIIGGSPEDGTLGPNWLAVSPDDRFLVRFIDGGVEVVRRDGGHRRRVLRPGFTGHNLFGKRGYFLGGQRPEQVIFGSYDGTEEKRFSTDAFRPLAESPDGRLVALATIKEKPPVRVEVWDVDEACKLCELTIPDGIEAAFSGPPYKLICTRRVEGKSGASWISSEFRVLDATTGKSLKTLDLSRSAGPAR
jgi:hypothetical protein